MLIIIEGTDGSGKSTLAEHLKDRLEATETGSVTLLHKSAPKRSAVEEYEYPLSLYRPGDRKHIICDRWHLGEDVYGPYFRDDSLLDDPAISRHLDMFLIARGAIVVYLHEQAEVIRKRLAARGEDLVDPNDIELLQDAYGRALARSPIPGIRLGYTDKDDDEDAVKGIIETAAVAETNSVSLAGFRTYVGPPHPSFLLLGERHNLKHPNAANAAFTPVAGSSSSFLLRNIPDEMVTSLGMANVLDENLPLLYSTLGRPLVVALGQKARRRCQEAAIPHGHVPHPAFFRRFRASDEEGVYRRAIRDAALTLRSIT